MNFRLKFAFSNGGFASSDVTEDEVEGIKRAIHEGGTITVGRPPKAIINPRHVVVIELEEIKSV